MRGCCTIYMLRCGYCWKTLYPITQCERIAWSFFFFFWLQVNACTRRRCHCESKHKLWAFVGCHNNSSDGGLHKPKLLFSQEDTEQNLVRTCLISLLLCQKFTCKERGKTPSPGSRITALLHRLNMHKVDMSFLLALDVKVKRQRPPSSFLYLICPFGRCCIWRQIGCCPHKAQNDCFPQI